MQRLESVCNALIAMGIRFFHQDEEKKKRTSKKKLDDLADRSNSAPFPNSFFSFPTRPAPPNNRTLARRGITRRAK